jgi:hypothetical protein
MITPGNAMITSDAGPAWQDAGPAWQKGVVPARGSPMALGNGVRAGGLRTVVAGHNDLSEK